MIKKIKDKARKTLRWSEKYTNTDMVYLAKGGSWLVSGQFISSLSAFLLSIVFANFLSKETFGTYQYVLSIAGILAIPTLSGINTSLIRSIAQGKDGSFFDALKTKIKFGLIGGVASLILAGYYYLNGNIDLTISFLIISVFLPFTDSLSLYGSIINGKKLFHLSTIYGSILNICRLIFLTLIIILTKNVFLIIFSFYFINTLLRFIFLKKTIKKAGLNDIKDPGAISYGKHLSFMNILSSISGELDKILLWKFLGAAPLAIYSFSMSPVVRIQGLFKSFESLAFPKIANQKIEVLKRTLPQKVFRLFLLTIAPTIIYIILAPWIYQTFFPQYLDSVIYSQVFAIIILFTPQKIIGAALTAHAQKKALYVISLVNPIVRIVSLSILLPIYGIMGAIISVMIPYFVNLILLIYFFVKMKTS